MTVVELFAGAGGAALGIRAAMPGAAHVLAEWDADACAVLRAAQLGRVIEADVHAAIHDLPHEPALLWASPPCQPYSRAGKRQGSADDRDCWPITLKAIQSTRPELVVIENVRGSPAEAWALAIRSLGYAVAVWDLDAADAGVPQRRCRRFVVASRIGPVSDAPEPTHSGAVLAWAKWGPAPTYWAEHGMDGPPPGAMPARWEVAAMRAGATDGRLRWRTVRDVLNLDAGWVRTEQITAVASTVDEPIGTVASAGNQYFHAADIGRCERVGKIGDRDGGRTHSAWCPCAVCRAVVLPHLETWRLDLPSPCVSATEEKGAGARTVEVSRHGWEGRRRHGLDRASDALLLATGRRRLTVEECATLQDFPADHPWHAARTKTARYRAVGNACPPALTAAVVRALCDGPTLRAPDAQIPMPWATP